MHEQRNRQRNEQHRQEIDMNDKNRSSALITLGAMAAMALGTAALLAGCGTSSVSKGVTDAGTADDIVFPEASSASARGGIFPNLDNLRQVGPGVTKDQLQDLLGAPHFAEGIGAVREWDYIFQFRAMPGTGSSTCQYKVLFDKAALARTFHWKPASCVALLHAPAMAAPPAMALAPQPERSSASSSRSVKKSSVNADGLFPFGKHASEDLLPEGRRQIAALAAQVQRDFHSVNRVRITGHADRLGTAAGNDALSVSRARTVQAVFARSGVSGDMIQVRGEGSRYPLVACPDSVSRAALVTCLQPNRRVEVEVEVATEVEIAERS
jgi:OOP family OmpA-OmpF porin